MKSGWLLKFVGLSISAIILESALPVDAQQYNYSYGDSRVVNQNQTGLYHPSGSYIGSGTLSQSAQGKSAGVGGGLPSVNMGAHVRTPGDNMYNNEGSERQANGALIYKDQQAALNARQRAIYRRRMQQMQPQVRQQGYLYVPGSNGAAATYGGQSESPIRYSSSGAATYGDSYNQPKSVRHF